LPLHPPGKADFHIPTMKFGIDRLIASLRSPLKGRRVALRGMTRGRLSLRQVAQNY
jgi:hypothetical protein